MEIIEQWDQRLKSTQQYKIAVVLLNSRKQGVPSLEKMMDYLLAFAGLSTEHCFPPEGSKQLEEFNKLQDQIQLDATKSVAGRRRKWTKSFCAEKIAMLIILHHELRAMRERNTRNRSSKKMTPLRRNFMTLAEMYHPLYEAHLAEQQAEENKRRRTPSLNYQLTGVRIQDMHPFDSCKKDVSLCPVCFHGSTMVCTESNESANESNARELLAAIKPFVDS